MSFNWSDKVVLITGGIGTVGQLVLDALFKANVKRIIIFSRSEHNQWKVCKTYNSDKLVFIIGDVKNAASIMRACEGVDVLIHTAAMKHIDICEKNIYEAIDTNVGGARNIVEACIANGVQQCLFVSTDKVNTPNNVYGTTKLLADKICISANQLKRFGNNTGRFRNESSNSIDSGNGRSRNIPAKFTAPSVVIEPVAFQNRPTCAFSVIRFGNIFGSNGSIVDFFRAITDKATEDTYKSIVFPITHMDIARLFIEQANVSKSILQCIENMKGGEIFIPEMKNMYIRDIANAFYLKYCVNRFSGDKTDIPIINVIGLRAGEKINESMISAEDLEKTWKTTWGMYVILDNTNNNEEKLEKVTNDLNEHATVYTIDEIMTLL
jgi:UDP-N-acetylglucosamine 4,6-dehydratase